jgi:hypothetical protein
MAIAAYIDTWLERAGAVDQGIWENFFPLRLSFSRESLARGSPLPFPQHTWNLTLPSSQSRTPLRIAHCGCFAYSGACSRISDT